jgi:hypothetical protein
MWAGFIRSGIGLICLLWAQKLGFVFHGLNFRQYIEWQRDGELQKIYSAALIYLAYSVLLLTVLHGISLRKEHYCHKFERIKDQLRQSTLRYFHEYVPLRKVKNGTRKWQMMEILHVMHSHGHRGCKISTRGYSGPASGLSAETVAIQVRFSSECSKNFLAVA